MTDDRTSPPDVLAAVEALREDVREDIGHLRDDMREDNERLEGRVMGVIAAHALEHEREAEERSREHGAFRDFMRAYELAQARKDGALGVFRFALELVSRHAKPIALVATSIAAIVAAATGAVQVTVGLPELPG